MVAMLAISPYLFAAMLVLLPAAHAATPAEAFVQDNVQQGYAILDDATLAADLRGEKFRALLCDIMDSKRVAVFTLGQYARSASAVEVDDFAHAFADFVAAVLQHDLAGNPGEALTVTGSVVHAPDDVIVNAKLTGSSRSNGQPIDMGFRIRKAANGKDTIVDLQVQGVSMAITQRSDFTAWLQQHHGDVAGLSKELRTRARRFRNEDLDHAGASASLR
jgi:phospholipid transport system substrate-binding protein